MLLKGIVHVHSTYSHDGKLTIEEIANICRKHEYDFAIITEHTESMNERKVKELVKECKQNSDEKLILIPGIELATKEDIHILGIGVKKFSDEKKIEKVIEFIHKSKGIAVLAHPHKYKKLPKNKFEKLDGIEIWNFEYEGITPRMSNIKLFKELKKKNKKLFAYSGLDFHRMFHDRDILTFVKTKSFSEKEILTVLKKGEFYTSGYFTINSIADINPFEKIIFNLSTLAFDITKPIIMFLFRILRKLLHFS